MPEFAFIDTLSAFLAGPAGLVPAPAQVGPALPTAPVQAPALVLALERVQRLGGGLGEGAEPMRGILPWSVEVDLAAPVLAGAPPLDLLSPDRTVLTLPHGGQIRGDGLDGALGPADIELSVAGQARTLVAASPGATEFSIDVATGRVTFGAPLPAAGRVAARYHLGSWERRSFLIAGVLALTARAATPGDVADLSAAAARALMAPDPVPGLRRLMPTSVGVIGAADPAQGQTRGRTIHFDFEYEHIVDAPDSSGGIISVIPLTTRARLLRREPGSGALVEESVTETG